MQKDRVKCCFFILCVLEVSLLEIKMRGFYQDKVRSFYMAENKLSQIEREISNVFVSDVNKLAKKDVKITRLYSSDCVVFYRIVVDVECKGAKTYLEGIFAKNDENFGDCYTKQSKSVEGRQSLLFN